MNRRLTREGFQKLQKEADAILREERPRVVAGIATAAAEGDRSENAEYIYGKKKLRELDKRLQYLSGLLKNVTVVDPASLRGDTIQFGATVVAIDDTGNKKTWTIVGEGEADGRRGLISDRAPIAKALLGKGVGDIVSVTRPKGDLELEVEDVLFAGRSVRAKA